MIVDEVMNDLGYTDPYFKSQISSLADAAIVELNIVGIKTICSSTEYSFEEYIPEQSLRALARNYIDLYVRIQFDPPQNSKQIDIMNDSMKRLRDRIRDFSELNLA